MKRPFRGRMLRNKIPRKSRSLPKVPRLAPHKVFRRPSRSAVVSTAPRCPFATWIGQTPNNSGRFAPGQPKFVIDHYTATSPGFDTGKFLRDPHSPSSSCHFVVKRDGKIEQLSGIDIVTWHAGQSRWKTKDGRLYELMNRYAIGIEHENLGFMKRVAGSTTTWLTGASNYTRKFVENLQVGKVPFVSHKNNPGHPLGWEPYPEAQVQASLRLHRWLFETIRSLEDVLGHDDISPGRKSDPGPAWPMARFKSLLNEVRHPTPAPSPVPKLVPDPAKPVGFMGNFGDEGLTPDTGTESVSIFGDSKGEPVTINDSEDMSAGDADEFNSEASDVLGAQVEVETLPAPPKPASKSVGIVMPTGGIIIAIFSVLGGFGLSYTDADVQSAQHVWPQLIGLGVAAVAAIGGSVGGIIGRYKAHAPIKGGPADPAVVAEEVALELKRDTIKKG